MPIREGRKIISTDKEMEERIKNAVIPTQPSHPFFNGAELRVSGWIPKGMSVFLDGEEWPHTTVVIIDRRQ